MIDVTYTVDDSKVLARFDQLPVALRLRLVPTIRRLGEILLGRVVAAEPRSRTGHLRAATRLFVDETDNSVRARVRILGELGQGRHNVKAAALNYGAHRAASVRAHQMRLGHFWDEIVAPRQVFVAAYSRHVNIAAVDFLQGPLDSLKTEARAEIEKAVADAAQGVIA